MAGRQVKMQVPQRRVSRQALVAVTDIARAYMVPVVQWIVQCMLRFQALFLRLVRSPLNSSSGFIDLRDHLR
jgi:hypothetical protein